MSLRTNLNNWLAMSVLLLGLASNVAGRSAPRYYVATDGDHAAWIDDIVFPIE